MTIMNPYTCSKCGLVSIIFSTAEKLENVRCSCGDTPVVYLKGEVKIEKPAAKNVVPAPIAPVAPAKPLAEPPKVFNPSNTVGTVKKSTIAAK